MRISSAFPSKYLRAADLPEDKSVAVVIDHVSIENVAGNDDPNDEKPVLYFQGKQKGVVLNRTNANVISAVYGDDTDQWVGKQVLLYATETSFQGKMMPCIRMRIPKHGAAPGRPAPQPVTSPVSNEEHFKEDDIPF